MDIRRHLNEAIETGPFLLPRVPGELAPLAIRGVQGRKTAISHFLANTVGAATLSEQTADGAIQEVLQIFARENKTFSWRVGPFSQPDDLSDRLIAAGLSPIKALSGMFIADWDTPFPTTDGITIRQAAFADLPVLEEIIRNTYLVHAPWAATLSRAYLPDSDHDTAKISTFLAFAESQEKPVGMAAMYWLPNLPIVYFGGAATEISHRRRGIYSNLVAYRLAAARQHGIRAAVIQAVDESAQACEKLGFSQFCEINAYIWESADQADDA